MPAPSNPCRRSKGRRLTEAAALPTQSRTPARAGGSGRCRVAFSDGELSLSVGIALGSASQIALFVALVLVLVLVLLSYVIAPTPMDLQLWPGPTVMIFIATITAALVTNSGRSAWFVGVLLLMVYLIFALTLYLLPPAAR